MKKVILALLAVSVSLAVTGCGTKLKTKPPNRPAYVDLWANGLPKRIYFKLTTKQVKKLGSSVGMIANSGGSKSGPIGWDSNIKSNLVQIREISGEESSLFKLNEVAVQY